MIFVNTKSFPKHKIVNNPPFPKTENFQSLILQSPKDLHPPYFPAKITG